MIFTVLFKYLTLDQNLPIVFVPSQPHQLKIK